MSASPFQILPSSHARARDTFPRTLSLEQALKARIRRSPLRRRLPRPLQPPTLSHYRQIPIGLVIPRADRRRHRRRRRSAASTTPPSSPAAPAPPSPARRCNAAVSLRLLQIPQLHGPPSTSTPNTAPPTSSLASSTTASATPPKRTQPHLRPRPRHPLRTAPSAA